MEEILNQYDTDKNTTHSYGPMYERLFSEFDRDAEFDILEIGVWHGGSLLAWRDRFPNANIYGVEVGNTLTKECEDKIFADPKMFFEVSDIKLWKPRSKFDIVIDDGSHFIEDMLWTAQRYPLLLKRGGALVIEDIKEMEWVPLIQEKIPPYCLLSVEDFRENKGRSDDLAVVIRNTN